jgi:flagellar basal-body rod modification protein FlgD
MSTSTGNLGLIPRYDPATANQVKTSNSNIGNTAEEIQNNFMKMLVAQMQNQNPLNPMDNAQFASQLAQMSQLQGIENMRASIDSFVKQVSSGRLLDQSAMIGKDVLAASSTVAWDGTSPVNFAVNADAVLSNAKLRITGYDGTIVDEISLGSLGPEIQPLSWDGNTKEGTVALSGSYRISIEGLTFDGKTAKGNVLTSATVQSVQRAGSIVQVQLNDGRVVNDTEIMQIGTVDKVASGS